MKKRISITGALILMMCIVVFVAISQTKKSDEKLAALSGAAIATDFSAAYPINTPSFFQYDVNTRFMATVTKEKLKEATSVNDILPGDAKWWAYPVERLFVERANSGLEKAKEGSNLTLNDSQLALLHSLHYSEDFHFNADYGQRDKLHYYLTVVPEKQANYKGGKDLLLNYLKRNSAADVAGVESEELRAGRVVFTVDAQGGVSGVRLSETSGYKEVDETMIKLIRKTSGEWEPAADAEGKNVDQELVFFFGRLGC